MALTRKMLKALGIADEQTEQIIDAHTETVDALKQERDSAKADADKLPEVQRQLNEANKTIEGYGKDSWKVKYDALSEEFNSFKSELSAKETRSAKENAYRALLKEIGVSDKRIDAVLKVTDIDGIELADGKIAKPDEVKASAKAEWADFITTAGTSGAPVASPPAPSGKPDYDSMSDDDYYKTITKKE